MQIKDLKEFVRELPDDDNIVISEPFIIDEKEQVAAIVDLPVVGLAYNEEGKELRFVLRFEDVKQVFKPSQVCQFDLVNNKKVENKEKE